MIDHENASDEEGREEGARWTNASTREQLWTLYWRAMRDPMKLAGEHEASAWTNGGGAAELSKDVHHLVIVCAWLPRPFRQLHGLFWRLSRLARIQPVRRVGLGFVVLMFGREEILA